nr:MAG TPA: hypothetical protein [Caudoviricetes sp.]DAW40587.1 MAG TPA: hypothetical protein [Caudoviricetes sp.]DAX47225.1 MAG TPA: hypothetical protein [Caudoviricetes sp.]DAX73927.1 MAG TPA: hypothetical protein [Caudoviricetes sp.]
MTNLNRCCIMCVLEMDSNLIAITHLFCNIVAEGVFYFI